MSLWKFFDSLWLVWILLCSLATTVTCQACKDLAHVHTITTRKNWERANVSLHYGKNHDYQLVKRLGAGAFAEGYLAHNIPGDFPCVIKIYHREKDRSRVLREILILQNLCGGPNIMKIYDVLKEKMETQPAIVFEYVNGTSFDVLMKKVEEDDVRYYMKELLLAIAYTHKNGVIHRDIKPSNVMFDTTKRQVRLIDFSLARFYNEGDNYTVAGTMVYKAPEVLLRHSIKCGPPADMWSFGALFAAIIFQKEPFFHGTDYDEVLNSIAKVLGSEDLKDYVKSESIEYDRKVPAYHDRHPKIDWMTLRNDKNMHLASESAIDAISKLLVIDPDRRMTATRALRHPYFDV